MDEKKQAELLDEQLEGVAGGAYEDHVGRTLYEWCEVCKRKAPITCTDITYLPDKPAPSRNYEAARVTWTCKFCGHSSTGFTYVANRSRLEELE